MFEVAHNSIQSVLRATACIVAFFAGIAAAQDADSRGANAMQAAPHAIDLGSSSDAREAEGTDAERIAAIENFLLSERERLSSLKGELERLQKEFDEASVDFTQIDAKVSDSVKKDASAELQSLWKDARDRFDLAITRRRAVREQIETIAEKISLAEASLEKLESGGTTSGNTVDSSFEHSEVNDVRAEESPSKSAISGSQSPTSSVITDLFPLLSGGTEKTNTPEAKRPKESTGVDKVEETIVPEELAKAREDNEAKQSALRAAENDLASLTKAESLVERELESTKLLRDADQNELVAAREKAASLQNRLEELTAADAPATELEDTRNDSVAAGERLATLQQNVEGHIARLAELQIQLERIRAAKVTATEELKASRSAAEDAAFWLAVQESPVAPHRIVEWVKDHGVSVLIIIILMFIIWWLSRIVAHRVISEFALRSRRGSKSEREMRAETLKRVFQSTASIAILVVGGLALLNEAGFDVTVLLGGAAVVGAAVAFGAQNLIKDYFLGFMILVENQYSVGNIIRLGEITGTVEDITLRMTVLRDLEGVVHFIPHSQVTTVSNLTHGWSQVVCDVGIGYSEDVDEVMDLLLDVARELRDDATFGPLIIGEADMLGVDQFADSAVIIRFVIKTRPLKQWMVKRELLRRIKKAFDKRGIEIPFPQRTLHIPRLAAMTDDSELAGSASRLRKS